MRIGICTGLERVADAAAAGYAYAEMTASTLLFDQDEAAFAPVRAALLASPLKVEAFNCFIPAHIRVTGPAVDWAVVARHLDIVLQRAAQVDAAIVVFGSGGARRSPDGFPLETARQQFITAARLAGETAAKYGITVVLEPLTPKACNFFNLVSQGAEFVDKIDHPNCRLLTDLFHLEASDEPLANIVAAGSRLAHAHLATPAIPATGEGKAYDFPGFFTALARAGYAGRVSLEDNPGLLGGKEPFVEIIRAAREYLESCLPVTA